MDGAIICSWRRPVNDAADQAISKLQDLVSYVKDLRDRSSAQLTSGAQGQSTVPQVSSYEVQVNQTGNHIGGMLIIRSTDVESLHRLQTADEYRDRIFQLVALFEDFETNVFVGGSDDRASREAVRVYRQAFQELATVGSRR